MQTSISFSSPSGVGDEKHLTKESKGGSAPSRLSEFSETTNESGNRPSIEKGSRKKKGKSTGNTRSSAIESELVSQEPVPSKSKRNQKKGKDTSTSHISESKRLKEDGVSVPSEDWIINNILTLVPEFEEQGLLNSSLFSLYLVLFIVIFYEFLIFNFYIVFLCCRCG